MAEVTEAKFERPIPRITPESAPFFEAAKRHELVVQKCSGCGTLRFPARRLCASCMSRESSWVKVSGQGEVYSCVVMHRVYHPAFASQVPYAVVIVMLAEGVEMTSNVIGVEPHAVKCGMAVEVAFKQLSDEITLPVFQPAKSARKS